VVAAGDGYVQAHRISTGEKVWELRLSEDGPATVVMGEGRVFVGIGADLFCIDLATGRGSWKLELVVSARAGGLHSRPTMLLEGDRLLVCADRALQCFSLTGEELWRQLLPKQNPASLATASGSSQYDVNTRDGLRHR